MNDAYKDQEWQDRLDQGKIPASGEGEPGIKAYQLLYEALEQPPKVNVPAGFAERVAQQAIKQSYSRGSSFWWLAIVLIAAATLICGSVLFVAYPSYFQLLRGQFAILSFAGLMFVAVQAADYYFIQRKQFIESLRITAA